jgi:hypothetical protein
MPSVRPRGRFHESWARINGRQRRPVDARVRLLPSHNRPGHVAVQEPVDVGHPPAARVRDRRPRQAARSWRLAGSARRQSQDGQQPAHVAEARARGRRDLGWASIRRRTHCSLVAAASSGVNRLTRSRPLSAALVVRWRGSSGLAASAAGRCGKSAASEAASATARHRLSGCDERRDSRRVPPVNEGGGRRPPHETETGDHLARQSSHFVSMPENR